MNAVYYFLQIETEIFKGSYTVAYALMAASAVLFCIMLYLYVKQRAITKKGRPALNDQISRGEKTEFISSDSELHIDDPEPSLADTAEKTGGKAITLIKSPVEQTKIISPASSNIPLHKQQDNLPESFSTGQLQSVADKVEEPELLKHPLSVSNASSKKEQEGKIDSTPCDTGLNKNGIQTVKNESTGNPVKTGANGLEEKEEKLIIPDLPRTEIIAPDVSIRIPGTSTSKKWMRVVEREKEEHTSVRSIGFTPVIDFKQQEPFVFPNVLMPKENSIIKFPRKGRAARKAYKTDEFKQYLQRYFTGNFRINDEHFILTPRSRNPLEPDLTLVNEKQAINIYCDVEIDEPYETTNDIANRKALHFRHEDIEWNELLRKRGWIIIRFAEIQVHQQPESCCLFISGVLKRIYPDFQVSAALSHVGELKTVRQWTKEEAGQWSLQKYRERYLGISSFGYIPVSDQEFPAEETSLGAEIEKRIASEEFLAVSPSLPAE